MHRRLVDLCRLVKPPGVQRHVHQPRKETTKYTKYTKEDKEIHPTRRRPTSKQATIGLGHLPVVILPVVPFSYISCISWLTPSCFSTRASPDVHEAERRFQADHDQQKSRGEIGRAAIDDALPPPQPEIRPEAVPKIQSRGQGDHAEEPKQPRRAAQSDHVARIAGSCERSGPDVSPVGDQTRPGEELRQVRPFGQGGLADGQQQQRQHDADNRSRPNDQQRGSAAGGCRCANRVRGLRMTLEIEPPVARAHVTCPSSWTACISSQPRGRKVPINNTWWMRFRIPLA